MFPRFALSAILAALTLLIWSGLWRLYRWLYTSDRELPREERLVLGRQLVAMGLYFPLHLGGVIYPVGDEWRGTIYIVAAFTLGYIGASAVHHRLFVAFNRNHSAEAAAVREGLAVAAGVLMLVLALVIVGLGINLLRR